MVTRSVTVAVIFSVVLMLFAFIGESARAENTLAKGQFVTLEKNHKTTRSVKIVKNTDDGTDWLVLGTDFSTAEAPDVNLLLHKQGFSQDYSKDNYVSLGKLQKFSGEQKYLVPEGINLKEYSSVVVWCKKFNVTFEIQKSCCY